MQVILKKDIPQLGRIGDLIKVREGYARNFLIPRAFAVPASPTNLRGLEHQKRLVELHKKKVQKDSQAVAAKMTDLSIEVERRFNESGKMYGTLSTTDLATELKKKDLIVDRRDIEVEAIKAPGDYDVKVRLPGDVYLTVKLTLTAMKEKKEKEEGKKTKSTRGTGTKTTRAKKTKAAEETETETEAETAAAPKKKTKAAKEKEAE